MRRSRAWGAAALALLWLASVACGRYGPPERTVPPPPDQRVRRVPAPEPAPGQGVPAGAPTAPPPRPSAPPPPTADPGATDPGEPAADPSDPGDPQGAGATP